MYGFGKFFKNYKLQSVRLLCPQTRDLQKYDLADGTFGKGNNLIYFAFRKFGLIMTLGSK